MKHLTLFFFSVLLVVSSASAEPSPRFAVVDLEKVFAAHPETAAATAELTKDREAAREAFKEQSNLLKETLQRHQELIRDGKKEEAAAELIKANEAEKAIATLRTRDQRDLEERFREAKAAILKDIREAVAEFNADHRFAMVFDSSSSSSNGLPQVVHAPGATDITTQVIAFLAKREKETKPAP